MDLPTPVLALVLLLTLAVGGVLGAAGYALLVARRDGSWREAAAADRARAEQLTAEVESLRRRAAEDASMLREVAPLRESLERVGRHVVELDRERAAASAALAEQLQEARRTDAALLAATDRLGSALHSRTARGTWGEVELRRVVEAAGMLPHVDFSEQRALGSLGGTGAGSGSSTGSRARPDMVVHLPGRRHVVIDAKVPMDAYLEAAAIRPDARGADAERRERLVAAHAKALRSHVDALAARSYHEQLDGSPELVVMFIPSEPLLGAALEADPGLLEHALRAGVAPTSPASLLALLRSVAAVWTTERAGEEAAEVLALGRDLADRLATVVRHVEHVGGSLRRTVAHYNSAVGSIERRLLVTARSFDSLGVEDLTLTPIEADDAQVREFTAPELVDRAAEGRPVVAHLEQPRPARGTDRPTGDARDRAPGPRDHHRDLPRGTGESRGADPVERRPSEGDPADRATG